MRLLAVLFVGFAVACDVAVKASFTFQIQLVYYENPTHVLQSGHCCEVPNCGPWYKCDNAFVFCVRERGNETCNLGKITTEKIAENDDTLSFSVGQSIDGTLTNPLEVSGDVWPAESVEIEWYVYDLDGSSFINGFSERVAKKIMPVPPLEPGVLTDELKFETSNCFIKLRFRLLCEQPASCPRPCEPTDDSSGHFTCDPATGAMLCLEGYRGPESRCTQCAPAPGCSEVGGNCTAPGECLCREGYTGDNCTECTQLAIGCSELGGYCTVPGECLCREGYTGDNCTECTQPAIGCNEVGGYCTVPGECLCREGYVGDNCTECTQPAIGCSEWLLHSAR
jgi:hypothetical protein